MTRTQAARMATRINKRDGYPSCTMRHAFIWGTGTPGECQVIVLNRRAERIAHLTTTTAAQNWYRATHHSGPQATSQAD